jgi:hypothetical protein
MNVFYDVMYKKNKIQMSQFIYSLLEVLAQVKHSHSVQALIRFYNRHPNLDPLKKKALFIAYIRKAAFNIDGIIIHSSLFTLVNCKDLPIIKFRTIR